MALPSPFAKRALFLLDACLNVDIAPTCCASEPLELPTALTHANSLSYGGVIGPNSPSFDGMCYHICYAEGQVCNLLAERRHAFDPVPTATTTTHFGTPD